MEEQFYLCWPFLAMRFGRKGLLFLSIALIPIAALWSSWLTAYAARPGFAIWTNSITEFECFAAGALLAIALHQKTWRISLIARTVLAAIGFACWAISDGVFRFKRDELLIDRQQLPHVLGYQLIVLGCCFLFLSIINLSPGSWSQPFIYLGRISYGLYVFHILALDAVADVVHDVLPSFSGDFAHWLVLAAAFALTAGLASLSYSFFESRFLRLKERFTYVRTTAAP